jgi:hypothetical protein
LYFCVQKLANSPKIFINIHITDSNYAQSHSFQLFGAQMVGSSLLRIVVTAAVQFNG